MVELGETLTGPPLVAPPVLKLVPLEVLESAQDQEREEDSHWIISLSETVKLETLGLLEIVVSFPLVGEQVWVWLAVVSVTVTVPFFPPAEVYCF